MATFTRTDSATYSIGTFHVDNKLEWIALGEQQMRMRTVGRPLALVRFETHPTPSVAGSKRLTMTFNDGAGIVNEIVMGSTPDLCQIRGTTGDGFFVTREFVAFVGLRSTMLRLVILHGITFWSITFSNT